MCITSFSILCVFLFKSYGWLPAQEEGAVQPIHQRSSSSESGMNAVKPGIF
jgi:hypothetical protein